ALAGRPTVAPFWLHSDPPVPDGEGSGGPIVRTAVGRGPVPGVAAWRGSPRRPLRRAGRAVPDWAHGTAPPRRRRPRRPRPGLARLGGRRRAARCDGRQGPHDDPRARARRGGAGAARRSAGAG